MSASFRITPSLLRSLSTAAAVLVAGTLMGCPDDEPEEEPQQDEEVVLERDRADEIPEPELAGATPDDFDPQDRPRIVEPDHWEVTLRAAGKPGAMPTELVAAVDRSVVRRGSPSIGPGTVLTVRDDDGEHIDVDNLRLTDGDSVFRADFEQDLQPGASYEVIFERVDFVFDETEDDTKLIEFDESPRAQIETPPLEAVDVSPARPVGRFGHVELRLSAPVSVSDLDDHLEWSLDGASPSDVYYNLVDERIVRARMQTTGEDFADIGQVELTGGEGLTSTLGGPPLEGLDETIEVGSDSDGLEIRAVGTYERAGEPTVRVLCHDPNISDEVSYQWDREIRTAVRDISRRCDVDSQRALQMVELDVDGEVSVVDHQHGFELMLDIDQPGGPVGIALRTGEWGEGVAELYQGHETVITPSFSNPELAVDADGRYLERSDWDRVPVRHRDVELAHVVVRYTADEHFPFWLAGGDEMDAAASFAIAEEYIDLDPGPAQERYSYIDLEELVGDPQPGAYQVEVSAPYRGGVDDSHRFLVSDVQLVAKRASHSDQEVDEVWAWTIDADTAEPQGDVELELIRQNGRVLAECTTDEEGFCELSGNWGDLENEPPFAVVAEGGEQLAYVDWEDTRTEIVEGEVGGMDYADEPAHRGALRAERTLYRPGETMEFAGFVRGDNYRAEDDLPIGVEITDSRGEEAYSGVYQTDEVGALEFAWPIPEMASTGSWNVELFAGDEAIAEQRVSVEEFVPERIEVEVDVDDEYVAGDEGVVGQLQADYFFGTPADGADFEIECRFEPTQPFQDQFPQYDFGPFEEDVDSTTARHDGTLDDDGSAEFNCDPTDLDQRAPYQVQVQASVFEAGSGSPTRSEETTTFLPGQRLVGLHSPDDRVDSDDGARLEGVVVGPGGEVLDGVGAVDLELGSVRYTTTRVRRAGRTSWERERHESIDQQERIDVDEGHFSVRVASRGNTVGVYVRAEIDGAITEYDVDAPRRFWWWGRQDEDPRPDDPAHVNIEGPDEITAGEPAEFSFEAPADGRALVAVETDRVHSWEWLDVEAGTNSWQAGVDYFDPNVYVSALYVPTGEDAPQGLDRGFGVKRVEVSRSSWEADVQLQVPDEREPGETLDIEVTSDNVGDDAVVAVAAVDRGILSMAAHEVENPLGQLFTTRALGVDTFDTVGWYADVSPEQFGGGAIAPPEQPPDAIMPVEPTSMWSGLVEMDDGQASVEFPIPDFRGEVEIAAVVVDDEHLGEATERTTIRDPLALQATAPRFATHGDEIRVPVSVTNTTERSIDVQIEADVLPDMVLADDDPAELEISGVDSASVQLAGGQRDEVIFDVEVVGRAGAPQLLFEASGGGEQSQHTATVPVYPDGPSEVEREHHSVDTREFDVLRQLDGWMPTSETTELWVTSIPRAPAFEHLEHVLHYPRLRLGTNLFNTVARVRPTVFLDRLLEAADPDAGHRGVDWRIRRGLRGIERLQQASGRFSVWSSGRFSVTPWGQAYVLDMLTSAENAGRDVPDWVMRDGLDWLDRRVQRRDDIEDLDLAMWVLARQGRPNRQAARELLDELPDNPTGRDHERALLATAALYEAGDETVEDDLRELIAEPQLGEDTSRFFGDFYTPARHEGLALEVGIEVFGADHELLQQLVEDVADRLVDAEVGELNLIELGWSIAALGRWAEDRSGNIPEARLIAAGEQIEPDVVGDDGSRSWQLYRASEYPEVRLEFDEQPDEPVSVFRRTEGVHEDAEPEFGSENLQLQRRFRNADGHRVNLDNVEVGDLIFVELEASHNEGTTLRNLALVDRIPGGFEIEDPRPEDELRPDWFDAGDEWGVDHFDVRDDRLEAFGSIRENQTVKFVYSIRATTAGTFDTPPSELTAMYQQDRWARIQGEPVTIERP